MVVQQKNSRMRKFVTLAATVVAVTLTTGASASTSVQAISGGPTSVTNPFDYNLIETVPIAWQGALPKHIDPHGLTLTLDLQISSHFTGSSDNTELKDGNGYSVEVVSAGAPDNGGVFYPTETNLDIGPGNYDTTITDPFNTTITFNIGSAADLGGTLFNLNVLANGSDLAGYLGGPFNQVVSFTGTATLNATDVVPEPAAFALFGQGALALVAARRR